MNTKFLFLMALGLFACSNPKQDKLQKKADELKCRYEFNKSLLDNSMNTMILLQREYKSELEAFQKLQADTTVGCDSLKNEWRRLSDLPRK